MNSFVRTLFWFLGNAVFGLSPLILMIVVKSLSNNASASKEVHHLLNDGLPLFVCSAIIGSMLVDFLLDGKKRTAAAMLFLIGIPMFVILFLILVYLLIILKVLPETYFSTTAWFYNSFIAFSAIYCIFGKLFTYLNNE